MTQHLKQLNYGMVGCGMMGQEHLRNVALLPACTVTAIFEPDAAMRKFAAQFAPQAVFVDSLDALLQTPNLDALVITSPNHCHAAQIKTITEKTTLPILLEKPVAVNLAETKALAKIAGAYTAPIWTAMEYRYMPPITALIERAHAKADTGEAVMFSIREHRYPFLNKVGDWNRFNTNTGGTLVEKCCHFFDLMRLVMQADPVRVYASGGQNHNHLSENYGGQTPDILDNAFVVLDFPPASDGGLPRRAMLDLCMFAEGARYQEELTVIGSAGKLECKVPGPGRFWASNDLGDAPTAQLILNKRHAVGEAGWTNNPSITATAPQTLEIPVDPALLAAGDHNGSTFYQHQGFANAVRGAGKVEVNLFDGIKAVIIGLAAEHSAKTGEAVSLRAGEYALN